MCENGRIPESHLWGSFGGARLVTKSSAVGFAFQNWFYCIFWLMLGKWRGQVFGPLDPLWGLFASGGPETDCRHNSNRYVREFGDFFVPVLFPGFWMMTSDRNSGVQKFGSDQLSHDYDPKSIRIKSNPTGEQVGLYSYYVTGMTILRAVDHRDLCTIQHVLVLASQPVMPSLRRWTRTAGLHYSCHCPSLLTSCCASWRCSSRSPWLSRWWWLLLLQFLELAALVVCRSLDLSHPYWIHNTIYHILCVNISINKTFCVLLIITRKIRFDPST